MGDRTKVFLTLSEVDWERYKDNILADVEPDEIDTDNGSVELTFYEVNDALIGCEHKLETVLIPYYKKWHEGGEYQAGETYFSLYPTGHRTRITTYDGQEGLIDVKAVLNAQKEGELNKLLRKFKNDTFYIPWHLQLKVIDAREEAIKLLVNNKPNLDLHLTQVLAKQHNNIEDFSKSINKALNCSDLEKSLIITNFGGYLTKNMQSVYDELQNEYDNYLSV